MLRSMTLAFLVAGLLSGCSREPAAASTAPAPAALAPASMAKLEADITRGYFSLLPEMATYYGVPDAIAGTGLTRPVDEAGSDR